MKKGILFLIVVICISMNQRVMAQANSQITTEELKGFYENGEYNKALSYVEQYKNKKDDSALIILGDCSWKQANIEEEQAIKSRNQMMINQSMAISQGLYLDNSLVLDLQQKIEQRIIRLRMQAVDLYSKASQLGNNVGTERLALINTTLGNNTAPINIPSGTSSDNSNIKRTRETCTYCKGTGVDPYPTHGASFGLSTASDKRCEICGKYDNHYHKQCSSCQGKGYREKISY